MVWDVIIIGGGVCGCSLLYALSRFKARVLLLEAENDVGMGTTKANSAIVHAGYDPRPGTLMAATNAPGNAMVRALCRRLDIPFRQTGSLVLAFTPEEEATLAQLLRRGALAGVPGLEILSRQEVLRREPGASPEVRAALYAPTAGVVSPWELALAQAEAALGEGAELRCEARVGAIGRGADGLFVVESEAGRHTARFVVNTAGVDAEGVCALLEAPGYQTRPSKGEYFLLDTTQGQAARHVLFPTPGLQGKGVLVAPTVHGNLIAGPNSAPGAPHDTATSAEGLAFVRQHAAALVPGINFGENIRNFAGVRARTEGDDFILRASRQNPGFFEMAGIASPGLTAAPALARRLLRLLQQAGFNAPARKTPPPRRRVLRFNQLGRAAQAEAIRQNPAHGHIICRCETVTEAEIVAAAHGPIPARSLDAVKRRVTAGKGRCQGGFCGPRVQAILARELGLAPDDIPQDRAGMHITLGELHPEGKA